MEPVNFEVAVQLARKGARTDAYRLLCEVLQAAPRYAPAWLWMSGLVDDPSQQRECLERVLMLDPNCEAARDGLAMLRRQAPPVAVVDRGPVAWKIGAYLVEYGFIDEIQLLEALEMQQARRSAQGAPFLGEILLERGLVTPHGLATVLMLQQQEQMSGPYARPPMRLGEQLIADGYLTIEQLATVLAQQLQLQQQGTRVRLGTLLIRERCVPPTIIEQALAQRELHYNVKQAA